MRRDRPQPVEFLSPTSYAPWRPVEPRDVDLSTPAGRDVDRAAYAADAAAVQRLLRLADETRAEFRAARARRTTPTEEPRMWSTTHQHARQAAREEVPPPTPEQLAWARQLRQGHRGGYEPAPYDAAQDDDDFQAAHPFGPGFDAQGRQLPSSADVDHSPAAMRRYEAAHRSGFTNDDALDAQDYVDAFFDETGNLRPGAPMYVGHQQHDIG